MIWIVATIMYARLAGNPRCTREIIRVSGRVVSANQMKLPTTIKILPVLAMANSRPSCFSDNGPIKRIGVPPVHRNPWIMKTDIVKGKTTLQVRWIQFRKICAPIASGTRTTRNIMYVVHIPGNTKPPTSKQLTIASLVNGWSRCIPLGRATKKLIACAIP
jgi:hypothetical protein